MTPETLQELKTIYDRQSEELVVLRRVCAHQQRAITALGTESMVDFWTTFCELTGYKPDDLGNMTPAEALRLVVSIHAAPVNRPKQPSSYVGADGWTQVPSRIVKDLGLEKGGGVCFVRRKDGIVEMLTGEQFGKIFNEEGEE